MARHFSKAGKRIGNNNQLIMRLPARPRARMPGMGVRHVAQLQMAWGKMVGQ